MRNIDWNAVEEVAEFEQIVPGGYIAMIVDAADEPSKEYIKMDLDIMDGKYAGYYNNLFDTKGFWGLNLYRSYKESALGFFKAFKNCVEDSNPGYVFNNDEKTLKGKVVGIVLGEEEYIKNDGSLNTRIYVAATKTVDDIKAGKFKVPALKKLPENTAPSGFTPSNERTPF